MSHPEISSLIKYKDKARDEFDTHQYEKGIRTTYLIIRELKKADQEKELVTKISKEIKTLDTFKYPGGIKTRVEKMKNQYLEWYFKIVEILWDKDYFADGKYKFHDPSNGRPSP